MHSQQRQLERQSRAARCSADCLELSRVRLSIAGISQLRSRTSPSPHPDLARRIDARAAVAVGPSIGQVQLRLTGVDAIGPWIALGSREIPRARVPLSKVRQSVAGPYCHPSELPLIELRNSLRISIHASP